MECASRFVELSRFALEYVTTDQIRMLRFEEGLVPYVRNQLVGQPRINQLGNRTGEK